MKKINVNTRLIDTQNHSENICGTDGCVIPAPQEQKPTLIYVFDGLCSYCYGFDTQLLLIMQELNNEVQLKIISGGMNIGSDMPGIKEKLGETFRDDYRQVVQITGANISEKYLAGTVDSDNYIVNSEIPARAFSAFKTIEKNAEKHLEFVFTMQKNLYRLDSEITASAFSTFKTYPNFKGNEINFITHFQYNMYHEGLNPNEDEIYLKTADHFGIAGEEFLQKMKMSEITEDVLKDFDYTQALQVTGFPHVFLKTPEEQYYLLARGYDKEENIAARIDNIEKELKRKG